MSKAERNKFKVVKKLWAKWGEPSRRVFNAMMTRMLPNQGFYTHTLAAKVPKQHWEVTCINAAFEAAEIVKGEAAPTTIVIEQTFRGADPGRVARSFVKQLSKSRPRA